MSYRITVKYDSHHSKNVDQGEINKIVLRLPKISRVGHSYYYEDRTNQIYFQIDLQQIDDIGKIMQTRGDSYINRVEIHIPAANLKKSLFPALKVAQILAQQLGWKIYDEHKKDYIALDDEILNKYDLATGRYFGRPEGKWRLRRWVLLGLLVIPIMAVAPKAVLWAMGFLFACLALSMAFVALVPAWRQNWHWGSGADASPVTGLGFLGIIAGFLMSAAGLLSEGFGVLIFYYNWIAVLIGYALIVVVTLFDPWRRPQRK